MSFRIKRLLLHCDYLKFKYATLSHRLMPSQAF